MDEHTSYRDSIETRVSRPGPEPTVSTDAAFAPADEPQNEPAAPTRRRAKEQPNTRSDFTEPAAPLQVKLPQDLIQSLKLHSIANGKTMSDLVLDCLTSESCISKAWISTRRAA